MNNAPLLPTSCDEHPRVRTANCNYTSRHFQLLILCAIFESQLEACVNAVRKDPTIIQSTASCDLSVYKVNIFCAPIFPTYHPQLWGSQQPDNSTENSIAWYHYFLLGVLHESFYHRLTAPLWFCMIWPKLKWQTQGERHVPTTEPRVAFYKLSFIFFWYICASITWFSKRRAASSTINLGFALPSF